VLGELGKNRIRDLVGGASACVEANNRGGHRACGEFAESALIYLSACPQHFERGPAVRSLERVPLLPGVDPLSEQGVWRVEEHDEIEQRRPRVEHAAPPRSKTPAQ